jgi:hypothetical protein
MREENLLSQQAPKRHAVCARTWVGVRDQLFAALMKAPLASARDAMLRLILKCMRYFAEDSALHVDLKGPERVDLVEAASLARILDLAAPHLAPRLRAGLCRLYSEAIPRARLEHSDVKDVLFRIGHFDSGGYHKGPKLKQETKQYLLKHARDVITALPRHRPAAPGRRWDDRQLVTFDPILDKVIDRHVFDQMVFVIG